MTGRQLPPPIPPGYTGSGSGQPPQGMNQNADYLIDRRRLKRRIAGWQVTAVVALTVLAIVLAGRRGEIVPADYIARITVDGIIVDDPARMGLLSSVASDPDVKAIIIRINSPGGTVVGGEALYARLRILTEQKPVVAVIGEIGTSAAYMIALGCDRIFASDGTLTGSIGVLLQSTDVTKLLDSIGIKPETVKSSPLKAQPNPLEPFTTEARRATEAVIADIYDTFVEKVSERRSMPREQVLPLADGRVFTGRQAVKVGLIDAIGGEKDAHAWLVAAKGIDPTLTIHDVAIDDAEQKLRDLFVGGIQKVLFSERLSIDAPVSVWHPSN